MHDVTADIAFAQNLTNNKNFEAAEKAWSSVFNALISSGNNNGAMNAYLHVLEAMANSGKLNAVVHKIHELNASGRPIEPYIAITIANFIKFLCQRGRNSDAVALLPIISRPDIMATDDYSRIYGNCALGLVNFLETKRIFEESPNDFKRSQIGKLINSIVWFDDVGMRDGYAKYSDIRTTIFTESAIVETFYLKHHLISRGLYRGRRMPDPNRRRISMSSIAHFGRLAHFVRNYVAARLYVDICNLELATPEWLGHYFFELDDPAIDQGIDLDHIKEPDFVKAVLENPEIALAQSPPEMADIFSPPAPEYWWKDRNKAREILVIRQCWVELFSKYIDQIYIRGKTLVCIHLRLGDMETIENKNTYGGTNFSAYQNWLADIWPNLDKPILYIASEDPHIAKSYFEDYAPITILDLSDTIPVATHLLDFYILTKSDILAISRGSFGLTAAILRDNPGDLYQQADGSPTLVEVNFD